MNPHNLRKYYVTFFSFKMGSIAKDTYIKTPCKYFDSFEPAKIFQLRGILEAQQFKDDNLTERRMVFSDNLFMLCNLELSDKQNELNTLIDEYPEFAI